MVEDDIAPELSNEEAHTRYAKAASAFMTFVQADHFDESIVEESKNMLKLYQDFTDDFLKPFQEMRLLEQNEDNTESPWTIKAQGILAGIQNLGM